MSKDFNFNRNHPRDMYFVKDFNNPSDKGDWKVHPKQDAATSSIKLNTKKEEVMKYYYFQNYSWRTVEPISKYEPDHNYSVRWNAFNTTTKEMLSLGWTIDIEFNKYTNRYKACFRNIESGLMTRVPFTKGMERIEIGQLFAVTNYKLKAAKFIELYPKITEEMIPELLEHVREFKKEKIRDFVHEQNKQLAEDKVIELKNYLNNQQPLSEAV